MPVPTKHWTERTVADYVHKIAADFISQIEEKMNKEGISPTVLAEKLGVTTGRVSQVLNGPGNLTLRNCAQYTRAVGMKAVVVAYEDGDPENYDGPVNPQILFDCWVKCGRPKDFFDLGESVAKLPQITCVPELNYVVRTGERESAKTSDSYVINLQFQTQAISLRVPTPSKTLTEAQNA
jgi:hypothetical protein